MRKMRRRVVVWMTFHGGLKIFLSACLLLMIGFIFTYELPAAKTWTYWTLPLSGKVIALDAGHGGPDGGAESKDGVIEKDINLAISLYLRDYLQQAGAVVYMTREEDKDLADSGTKGLSKRKTEDLLKRADMINKMNASLFLSVHLNSIPSAKWHGAQTFYYPGNPDNLNLAGLIQDELRSSLKSDRAANTVNTVYLLKTLKIPSALVEVGFLSNPEEARMLAQTQYQQKVATAIYHGIIRFYAGEKIGSR